MDWVSPVAALVGVIVGGVLNARLAASSERRRERAEAAVATRLVRDELRLTLDTVRASLRDGRWGAILDPGLPYSRGLWAVEHREGHRAEAAWPRSAPSLARVLTAQEWERLSTPYAMIERISLTFWTDDPDRDLTDEARAFLTELCESVPPALRAVEDVQARLSTRARRPWSSLVRP